jgi:ribosomal subunit interface protein
VNLPSVCRLSRSVNPLNVVLNRATHGAILRLLPCESPFPWPADSKEGAPMKIFYSNIEPEHRKVIDGEAAHQIEKLKRLLKRYDPDLIELHLSVEKAPRKIEYVCSVNLRMPTGNLHASGTASDVRKSAKAAFAEIETQVKKHQERLRKDYLWKRKRGRGISDKNAAAD